MPEQPLVMCDIDGTLIDGSYSVTDPTIYGAIKVAQHAGWTVGLSSDSPYESMVGYRKKFEMNGPIIAERGSVVEWGNKPLYDGEDARRFAHSFGLIKEYLTDNDIIPWVGNPVEAIASKVHIASPGDTAVLMNGFRRCSLGIFPRVISGSGEMLIDRETTDGIAEKIRFLYPQFSDVTEEINHEQGLLIVSRDCTTKRVGSQRLLDLGSLSGRFAMVGNSIADYVGSDIAVHYAVGGASSEFCDNSDFVAEGTATSGVVDVLRRLVETGLDDPKV